MKKVRDHYFHKAKKEGLAARSAFKIEEIDRKHRLFKPGMTVLDLGCRPGSWLQYISKRVGKNGLAVGLDIRPVTIELPPNCRALVMDATEPDMAVLGELAERFDAVVSDMAPDTTGVKFVDQMRSMNLAESALAVARRLLRPGGYFVVKIFQGPGFEEFLKELRAAFTKGVVVKPDSSRKESKEIFLVGLGLREASD